SRFLISDLANFKACFGFNGFWLITKVSWVSWITLPQYSLSLPIVISRASYWSDMVLLGYTMASAISLAEKRLVSCVRSGPMLAPLPCTLWQELQRAALYMFSPFV